MEGHRILLFQFLHVLQECIAADDGSDGHGRVFGFRLGLEDQIVIDFLLADEIAVVVIFGTELVHIGRLRDLVAFGFHVQIGLVVHLGLDRIQIVGLMDAVVGRIIQDQQGMPEGLDQLRTDLKDVAVSQLLGIGDVQSLYEFIVLFFDDGRTDDDRSEDISRSDFIRSGLTGFLRIDVGGRIKEGIVALEYDFAALVDRDCEIVFLDERIDVFIPVFFDIFTERLFQFCDLVFTQFEGKCAHNTSITKLDNNHN